jgi:hypothetical protein
MASRTLPRLKQVVLNDVFTQALEQARQKPLNLTQNQQVICSLNELSPDAVPFAYLCISILIVCRLLVFIASL